MKKFGFYLLILFVLFIIQPFTIHSQNYDPSKTDQKLAATLQIIRFAYVDSTKDEKLVEKAIIAMLKELDPHSVYISKEEIDRVNEPLVGNFEGVGIQFQIIKDTILVISPIPGGPSEEVGVMAGDKIIKINEENATGPEVNNKFVFDRLRGKKGTKVTMSMLRRGKPDLIDFIVTRDKIPINSVDAAFMVSDNVGYIKLNRFSATSVQEVREAIDKLKETGMKNLIMDLRSNAGGYMNAAIELSDEFLDDGKLVVYTEGMRSPVGKFNATKKGSFEKGKLVVLINEGSASSSEIVAGAVQDWDRGIIIGRRSFGKGLVQRPFNLPDGSVIRLTTARYHTPSGRCIQKSYKDGSEKYSKDLLTRYKKGEFTTADSIKLPDSLKYYTAKKRIVYGGGGIMPDIFVPLDTTKVSDYYSGLIRKGILNEFVVTYTNENRNILIEKYPDIEIFKKEFSVDTTLVSKLTAFAEKEGLEYDEEGLKKSEIFLYNQLKALIARNLWGLNAFYQISVDIDNGYQKAFEVISDNSSFRKLRVEY